MASYPRDLVVNHLLTYYWLYHTGNEESLKDVKSGHDFEFPIAAATNYHKLSGLKQHNCHHTVLKVRSPKWISVGQNQGICGAFLLEALERIGFLSFFSCPHFLALVPFLTQKQQGLESISYITSFWHRFPTLPTLTRTLMITLGLPGWSRVTSPSQGQLISNLNSICNLSPLFPYNIFIGSGD